MSFRNIGRGSFRHIGRPSNRGQNQSTRYSGYQGPGGPPEGLAALLEPYGTRDTPFGDLIGAQPINGRRPEEFGIMASDQGVQAAMRDFVASDEARDRKETMALGEEGDGTGGLYGQLQEFDESLEQQRAAGDDMITNADKQAEMLRKEGGEGLELVQQQHAEAQARYEERGQAAIQHAEDTAERYGEESYATAAAFAGQVQHQTATNIQRIKNEAAQRGESPEATAAAIQQERIQGDRTLQGGASAVVDRQRFERAQLDQTTAQVKASFAQGGVQLDTAQGANLERATRQKSAMSQAAAGLTQQGRLAAAHHNNTLNRMKVANHAQMANVLERLGPSFTPMFDTFLASIFAAQSGGHRTPFMFNSAENNLQGTGIVPT